MATQNATHIVGGCPFGRIPSLTAQIRELIHDYPEGIGIIKELAQNADDAGARTLKIVIDRRAHATERLPTPAMAALQGPALLFFNDSVFTEEDFDRIQEIYRSGKVRAADKTGQFGKGFNTVYNVTDWPSFVTGERVAFFDPHCSVIPGADRLNPGRSWTLAECWEMYPDLLAPFGAAGLEAGAARFEGTIFRLPFRTPAQAARSEISRKPFGDENLRGLIDELADVRESLLPFLKRLEAIRLHEVLESGDEQERVIIETVNVREVREKRQDLLDFLRGDALTVVQRLRSRSRVLISYQHHFRCSWVRREGDEEAAEDSAWRVLHCLSLDPEGKIAEAVETLTGGDVKAIPFGGAAARLSLPSAEEEPDVLRGKVFCSLPLPIDTGLPVHLNGFFDLDSSRHSLTTDAGLTGGAKVRARWNQLLVEHVVAPAYAHLIDQLVEDLGEDSPARYYAAWPHPGRPLPKAARRPCESSVPAAGAAPGDPHPRFRQLGTDWQGGPASRRMGRFGGTSRCGRAAVTRPAPERRRDHRVLEGWGHRPGDLPGGCSGSPSPGEAYWTFRYTPCAGPARLPASAPLAGDAPELLPERPPGRPDGPAARTNGRWPTAVVRRRPAIPDLRRGS